MESLPPLNKSTGRSSSAATSRMMKMACASRVARVDWRGRPRSTSVGAIDVVTVDTSFV